MAFATPDDVAARLGRDLTTEEEAFVEAALDDATAAIAEAAGKNDEWSEDLDPVPKVIKALAVSLVVRAGQNTEGVVSRTEALGQYSVTDRFPDPRGGESASGIFLSDDERRLVRRVVFGRGSGTAIPASVLDGLPDWEDFTPFLEPFPVDGNADLRNP